MQMKVPMAARVYGQNGDIPKRRQTKTANVKMATERDQQRSTGMRGVNNDMIYDTI